MTTSPQEALHIKRNRLCELIGKEFARCERLNSCLGQAYFLQQLIIELKLANESFPTIVLGHVEDDQYRLHWRHFWVECDTYTYDPATITYWLLLPKHGLAGRVRSARRITKKLTTDYDFSPSSTVSPQMQIDAYNYACRQQMWSHIILLDPTLEMFKEMFVSFMICQRLCRQVMLVC